MIRLPAATQPRRIVSLLGMHFGVTTVLLVPSITIKGDHLGLARANRSSSRRTIVLVRCGGGDGNSPRLWDLSSAAQVH
ncbi:hypothetical protein BDV09DRAFT_101168 [Aspergillus tetrazonus]